MQSESGFKATDAVLDEISNATKQSSQPKLSNKTQPATPMVALAGQAGGNKTASASLLFWRRWLKAG